MSTIFCFVFVLRQREIEQKISGAAVFCLGHFATNKVPWNRLFYLSSRPARSFAIFTLDSFDAPCKVNKKVLEWINVKVKVHVLITIIDFCVQNGQLFETYRVFEDGRKFNLLSVFL